MQPSDERRDRADIESLLTRWYAREPSDVAARQIPERLLAPARSLDDGLPHEVQTLASAAFWGCRTAARLWKDPDISAQRSAELAALLETAVREPLDRSLEATELENQCVAALARRYYAALPHTAAEHPIQTDPEKSSHRWERLASQADDVLRRTADEPNNPDILLQQALDRTLSRHSGVRSGPGRGSGCDIPGTRMPKVPRAWRSTLAPGPPDRRNRLSRPILCRPPW